MIDANAEIRARRDELQTELATVQTQVASLNRKAKSIRGELEPLNRKLKTENLIVGSRWYLPSMRYYSTTRKDVLVIHKTETYVIYIHGGQPERMGMQDFLSKAAFRSLT